VLYGPPQGRIKEVFSLGGSLGAFSSTQVKGAQTILSRYTFLYYTKISSFIDINCIYLLIL
jgi:hypothetical protein